MFPFRIAPAAAVDSSERKRAFLRSSDLLPPSIQSRFFPAGRHFLFSTAHHLALPFAFREETHNRMQTLQLFRQIENNFDAAQIVTTDCAKSFDATQRVDAITIETITSLSAINHRRKKLVLAVNENSPPRDAD
jgi:hypothetical protein